ncbi:unnamed protein product [Toxocara canis]|uniref:SUZ domain-containing protein n=1 Tax=Toxocara canis TaxID=6265 RepID=A0A183VHF7_TOXCA|nr:unnamed protein product [Toxocara canis]
MAVSVVAQIKAHSQLRCRIMRCFSNYADLSHRASDGAHTFSISPSDCTYIANNNAANVAGQSGAGTDSTEDGPDVVELPDSDEELARIQANNAAAAQRAYAMQVEQMGVSQVRLDSQANFMSQPPPDWNMHAHNPYVAPPFCTSQYAYQQQQPYQFMPPQHVAVSYSQPVRSLTIN